jgi:hypothetical protein
MSILRKYYDSGFDNKDSWFDQSDSRDSSETFDDSVPSSVTAPIVQIDAASGSDVLAAAGKPGGGGKPPTSGGPPNSKRSSSGLPISSARLSPVMSETTRISTGISSMML